MDVGCYCVNGARMLAGEPDAVTAQQVLGGDGVDVVFAGTMSFADEVLAHFDAGLALATRDELEVVGDQGSLFLDDPWHCVTPMHRAAYRSGTERIELTPRRLLHARGREPVRGHSGQAAPLLGRADAVGQATAIGALYEAARPADDSVSEPMDDAAQRRLASNEDVFRRSTRGSSAASGRVTRTGQSAFAASAPAWAATCCCELTLAEYEHVRSDPRRFVMIPGHEVPEVETVVDADRRLRDRREARRGRRAGREDDPRSDGGVDS